MTVRLMRKTADSMTPKELVFKGIQEAQETLGVDFNHAERDGRWVSPDGIEVIYPADDRTQNAIADYQEACSFPAIEPSKLVEIGFNPDDAEKIASAAKLSKRAEVGDGLFILRGDDAIKMSAYYLLGEKAADFPVRQGEVQAHKTAREGVGVYVDYSWDFVIVKDEKREAKSINELFSRPMVESNSIAFSFDAINEDTPSLSRIVPLSQSTGSFGFVEKTTQHHMDKMTEDNGSYELLINSAGLTIDEGEQGYALKVTEVAKPAEVEISQESTGPKSNPNILF